MPQDAIGTKVLSRFSYTTITTKIKSKAYTNKDWRANRSHRRLANFITVVEQVLNCHEEINAR
jgi:hypothetical protein